ncbi:MAG: FHA domain-containing protein [Deltaproteobacteria bacterium]|nr:FHA domain-containing protein [Deltaproteobacteria bacterium]
MLLALLALLGAPALAGVQVLGAEAVGEDLALTLAVDDGGLQRRLDQGSLRWGAHADGLEVRSLDLSRASQGQVLTLFAIDQTGSFRPYHQDAVTLAGAWVRARSPHEAIGAVHFGLRATAHPTARTEAALEALLREARDTPPDQRETRLGEHVRGAVDRAARELPPSEGGLRQVVLFTDGDEESSAWSVDEVAGYARERGVLIHVVAFYKGAKGARAERLDNLSRLAAGAGGGYLQVESLETSQDEVKALARAQGALWVGRADLCGGSAGGGTLVVSLEDDAGAPASAASVPFTRLVARPCEPTAGGDSDRLLPLLDPHGPAEARAGMGLVCGLLGLLALVGGVTALAFFTGMRREEPPPAPAPAPPPPPAEPPPPPARRAPLPAALPERHLVRSDSGERWRFSGRALTVGASAGCDVTVDLPELSGEHARFDLFPSGDVYVTDLQSTNGTWMGGARLLPHQPTLIPPGGQVSLSRQLALTLEVPQ